MKRRRNREYHSYRSYSSSGISKLWHKFKNIILALSIIVPVLAGLVYIFLLYPLNIECGIVVDRQETDKYIRLKLSYDDETKWVRVNKNLNLPKADGYSVSMKGVRLLSIVPLKTYSGKVLLRSQDVIELEDKTLEVSKNPRFIRLEGDKVTTVPQSRVVVGYSTYKFITDKEGRVNTVIVDSPVIDKVRIGISNEASSGFNHTMLVFSPRKNELIDKSKPANGINYYPGTGLKIKTTGLDYTTKTGESIQLLYENGSVTIILGKLETTYNFTPKQVLGTTKDRIYISKDSLGPTLTPNLIRGGYYRPVYFGSFEVSIKDNAMRLINEVDVENYLRFVVPSEMSPYAKAEGYKAQAVAARTYALSDMLSGRFAKSGFHVDDTIQSQVYNAQPSRNEIDLAITETAGEVMTYKGGIIDAKYYSTSAGVGAPFNQVWYNGKDYEKENTQPYLIFHDYTGTNIKDLSSDEAASEFFKDWTIKGIDSDFKLFRWKVTMTGKALENNINKLIHDRSVKDPESFKKKWYFNIYRKSEIPEEGVGTIQDVFISKRGIAGNVLEMTIVASSGTYKVERESHIKRLVVPNDENLKLENKLKSEDYVKNYSYSLPSGFFTIDREMSGGKIKTATLYGGGFGHGVGMSQNGVVSLERQGKKYRDILFTYYTDVDLLNFREILK